MPPPLRVAHLTATFPPYEGGAGNVCFDFAAGLARRGHRVEVFTASSPGEPADPEGVTVHRLRPRFRIGNAPLLPQIASLEGFDVIELFYPFIFGTELLLARQRRRRPAAVVVGYHNRLIGTGARRPLFWAYEESWGRLLARHADRICVVSRAHAGSVNYLRSIDRREPGKLIELPNGVDTDGFAPGPDHGVRERMGIPAEAKIGVFVATLDRAHAFKRLDLAIEALAQLDRGTHLLVVGDGELLPDYRRQAEAAGIGARVHFAGGVGHGALADHLRAADFMLLATQPPESFAIVLIEAMACGVPVVVTEYPGVRAVVEEGRDGLIAPAGDVGAIAAASRQMIEMEESRRHEMGAAGRRKVESLFGWPSLVERLEDAYREALEVRESK
jgi:glycosyltransferase involved in cell wall biosynthesis